MGWNDEEDRTPYEIATALQRHDFKHVRQLLNEHPEFLRMDDGTDTWLWRSAASGDLAAVKLIVEIGIDVNESHAAHTPITAIHSAASNGHLEVVRWLIENGAKVNFEREGHNTGTVLRRAVSRGHFDIVKLLVEHGADIHGHWHGVNALMDAEFYGQHEIAAYLRSLGAKDLRETTAPDYAASRQRLIENMVEQYGPLTNWTIKLPGTPTVTIHHIAADAERQDPPVQTLFTIGLSDHRLPDGHDPFHCTELRITLPADWPLTKTALADADWNWPVEWLKRITARLRDADQLFATSEEADFPPLFMNDDPPKPLANNTKLCGWVGMRSSENHCQMDDCRWISLLDLYPIYAEERDLVLSATDAYEELMERFEDREIPMCVDPQRENVVTDEAE